MTSQIENKDDNVADNNRHLVMQHWLKFEAEFPEGSDGTEQLCDMLFACPDRRCPKCRSNVAVRLSDPRYVRCSDCKRKYSLTAETFFHNARRPKAYLGAIRLVETGIEFSAHMLAKLANVAYDTAWEILKKIDVILKKSLDAKAALLPSKLFEDIFRKRSRLTPAKEHPREEQRVAEREMRDTYTLDISTCSEEEQAILQSMEDKVVAFDFICERTKLAIAELTSRLVMLELKGWIFRLGPDSYRRTSPDDRYIQPDGDTKELLDGIIDYLKSCTKGISRKYLHFYLARIWSVRERDKWTIGALLKECLSAGFCPRITLQLANAPLLVPFASALDPASED